MIWSTVFLVSFSALAFEVLLTRLFSITQWNHLSFMVISLALFGFAASGTFLNLMTAGDGSRAGRFCTPGVLKIGLSLFSICALLAYISVQWLPLDYFRLPVEPHQALYLLLAYLALSLPFFMAGLIIAVAYAVRADQSGRVYFATMLGSAGGALVVVPGLPLMGESGLIVVTALLPLVLLLVPNTSNLHIDADPPTTLNAPKHRWVGVVGPLVCSVAVAIIAVWAWRIPVTPSPYKALSQHLRFPGTQITETHYDIRGRIDLLQSPYIRFAPGLSLKYTTPLPAQSALYRDGDNPMVLYDFKPGQGPDFAAHSLPFLGYYLHQNPRKVLILAQGGGSALACALAAGTDDITVVTPHPEVARQMSRHYGRQVVTANPRGYLLRTRQRFDVIHIDDWGQSMPGSGALHQSHLFTIQALQAFQDHLRPGGMLIMARKLLLPPSDTIRLWATAYEALYERGVSVPERYMVMMRNWDLYTLVTSTEPLAADPSVATFARQHNFDLLFQTGGDAALTNRFNRFDHPFHARAIAQLAAAYADGRADAYFDTYPLDVRPQSDLRPFPYRILKWSRISALYQSMGSRLYALVMSGEVVVLVVLAEAVTVAAILLAIPWLVTRHARGGSSVARALYFLSVGAGFMLVEIYYIKRLMLIFEGPVVVFTVVVAGILFFSSLGGLWAQRCSKRALRWALLLLCAAIVATALIPGSVWLSLAALAEPWRHFGALAALLPIGILLGIPFPVGMRRFVNHPAQSATAWALNGCASVVAAIAAAQIALSAGLPYLLAGAALAYLLAFSCVSVYGLDR